MHFRSWLAFSAVIAVVQCVLAVLAVLQHNAIFSDLLRQRISVIAQTTASSFQPIVDLGLPIAMIRNGNGLVARALEIDREIRAVHAINPSGIVVYTTADPRPENLPAEITRIAQRSETLAWSVETQSEILSGYNIVRGEDVAGAIVVAYPKDRLDAASREISADIFWTALFTWAIFSAASYALLASLLGAPQRAIARLDVLARQHAGAVITTTQDREWLSPDSTGRLFRPEIETLERNLAEAARQFEEALRALESAPPPAQTDPGGQRPDSTIRNEAGEAQLAADASRSLARKIASRLTPPAALFIVVSALILGITVLQSVNRSIEPELAARTNLIGTVVGEQVERAVAAGAPLDRLVGAESYFGDMLLRLPEVAYVAVATGRIVLEAGQRIDPYLAPPRERKDVRSHPIHYDGEEIAYVVVDIDPAFISRRFVDVFLDMSVVILVAVLIAFEVMVLLTSRSLTAALDALQRLAAMQAAGDFSKRATLRARGAIARLTATLVERADALHAKFASALSSAAPDGGLRAELEALGPRYKLSVMGPMTLRISHFTDIRLALFLFAAADELPLSFLPLYTRDAINLWPWLDQSVLISLPLAGYLLAIMIASPFSRSLSERIGVRALFVLAAIPTFGAHVGLYFAGTAQEIILWRTVSGFGYAFVTLACQDYVLGTVPRDQRDRTLGVFTLVLFGGIFSGAALGGVLANRLGQDNVFLLSATLIAFSAVLSARLIARDAARSDGQVQHLRARDILATLRNAHFSALVFGLAIPANVLLQAFISYLVALTLDALGASTADIGRALMVYFLAVIAVGPLGGRAAEAGFPVGLIALSGAALAGASLTLTAASPSYLGVVLTVLGTGIGHGLLRGAQVSLAMTIAETELSRLGASVVLGALRTLERLGSIVGLVAIAGVAGYAGYGMATGAVAVWTLVGAAVYALLYARPESQTAPGAAE